MPSVLQEWVQGLSFMQQTVLITATRGPDGIRKDHISKLLIRWLRRCYLISAFDGRVLEEPFSPYGGSFTGPSIPPPPRQKSWQEGMNEVLDNYLHTVDELPHHF